MSGTLTYWVVDTIADELGSFLDTHREAHISINVPPEILGRGGLEYAAARSGLIARADQIVLEITERGVPDQLGLVALDEMAKLRVRVALDDTTLNGVNMALLARRHFDLIKVDRELVALLKEGAEDPPWAPGLAALLRSSELQVVAEGVETEHQASVLKRLGVQFAAGHLYSTPLRAAAFVEFHERSGASGL